MIDNLPSWITLVFILTFFSTIVFFHYANNKPKLVTFFILLWSLIHAILAYLGFYQVIESVPPRFALVLIPSTIIIIYGLMPKQRQWVLENRNIKFSTFLHSIRLPMEIVLFGLFINKMIPEIMTFEGRNFDIIMGVTAPIIGWLVMNKKISKKLLLFWNILGLVLIMTILIIAILSAELPFQQFGFEQPNQAVNFFPFILLPATIVPIVIWTHLTDIIKLRFDINHGHALLK